MRRKLKQACLMQLRQTFQVNDFRPGQKAAASALLSGRDLLCILPTGAGKSLCWQLPAVMHQGLTVVVSPLIALMQDQVRSLHTRGIRAVTINSLMTRSEQEAAAADIRTARARIVFVSPERLETGAFWQLCGEVQPWLVVVDEAHCVVSWGGEFRPAYSRIGAFVEALPARPVLCAMTATADQAMQRQIVQSLRMAFPKRVTLPVLRPNLHYHVRTTTMRTREILRIAAQSPCRTVIFCCTRIRTEQLAEQLRSAGLAADHYHAGLNREARMLSQQRFQRGETLFLAATTAFGMGIDIPDIRRVIHDSLPDSITDLVQQTGRAGRDGRDAECIILLEPGELIRRGRVFSAMRIAMRFRPLKNLRAIHAAWTPLRELLRVILTAECIPAGIAAAFGQRAGRCGQCSACRRGPLVKRVPPLPYQREDELRLWLLRWQRDALAAQQGAAPKRIASQAALREAAHTLTIPPLSDQRTQLAMERLMDAICRAEMHEKHEEREP